MIKKKPDDTSFLERAITAIAMTLFLLGYYRLLSSANAAPFEILDSIEVDSFYEADN